MPKARARPDTAPRPLAEGGALRAVGLTDSEERVYRALVSLPGASVAELEHALGLPGSKLKPALSALARKGFAARRPGRAARFVAAPPDWAIDVAITRRVHELEEARAVAVELSSAFRSATESEHTPSELLEVIEGRQAVAERYEQLRRQARREVLRFDKPPYAHDGRSIWELDASLIRSGVIKRSVYDTSALDHPGYLAGIEASVRAGEQARVFEGLPTKFTIADDRLAMTAIVRGGARVEAALLVRPSPLLLALRALFEMVWERAVPIPAAREAAAGKQEPAPQPEERIRVLLAAGLKDAAIARQLGVSPSTVRRRIREMMSSLGVSTRVQLGIQLARSAVEGGTRLPDLLATAREER